MTAGQLDLFQMNAHGDIWEAPDLFAAPVPWTVPAVERIHVLEEVGCEVDAAGRVHLVADCEGCPSSDPECCYRYQARADTIADAWRILEGAHSARREVEGS